MKNRPQALLRFLVFLAGAALPAVGSAQDANLDLLHALDIFKARVAALAEVEEGEVIADIGAGAGNFSFRLAELVGPGGFIYANEIDPEMIERIEGGREERELTNMTVILGTETDPRLPGPVDVQFFLHVYHHLSKPDEFMENTVKYLKPGGRLVITADDINDFRRRFPGSEATEPCISDPEETREAIERAGYVFERRVNLMLNGGVSYVLVFRAPPPSGGPRAIPWTAPPGAR